MVMCFVLGLPCSGETLLSNSGALTSTTGPNPQWYNNGIDPDGKTGTCLYPHAVSGSSYGALGFDSTSYNPDQGRIGFWYKPGQTTGNIIFCMGGDPGVGGNSNFLGLYQNWFWGNNYPVVAASIGGNTWGYMTYPASQSWTWDTGRWYFIEIAYKMCNSTSDFINLYIDGVKQTGFNGSEYRNITAQPRGDMSWAGYTNYSYYHSPARFDDIMIKDTATRTLLLNHGQTTSAIGPDPILEKQTDTNGKFGNNSLYPHAVPGSSYGSLGFPSSAYNPQKGTIEFWYKPDQTTGNIIFNVGGNPESSAQSNILTLYQNWWWGNNYPVAASSMDNVNWGYLTYTEASSRWIWDTSRWYHIAVTYKTQGTSTDFVNLFIDGKLQYACNGYPQRSITSSPTGDIWFAGFMADSFWYSASAARFDEIRIMDDIIYTEDFTPPTAEFGEYTASGRDKGSSFADRQEQLRAVVAAGNNVVTRAIPQAKRYPRDCILASWINSNTSCALSLSAARNEVEGAQFVVVPLHTTPDTLTYTLTATDLTGPGGATIAASNIKLQQVGYIPTINNGGVYSGYYADALMPSGTLTVKADCITPVYVRVKVPTGTAAGNYTGTISFQGGQTAATISLHVYHFTLPDVGHIKTSFWLSRAQIEKYFGMTESIPWATHQTWLQAVCDARLSPIDYTEGAINDWFKIILEDDGSVTPDLSDWIKYANFICSRNATAINLGTSHWFGFELDSKNAVRRSDNQIVPLNQAQRESAVKKWLNAAQSYLRGNGWDSKGYVQGFDEPHAPDQWSVMQRHYTAMRLMEPNTKYLVPFGSLGEAGPYKDIIDIWVPRNGAGYGPAPNDPIRANHKSSNSKGENWTYACWEGSKSIIHNSQFVNRRYLWESWGKGSDCMDGILYWGVNQWGFNPFGVNTPVPTNQTRWPSCDWTYLADRYNMTVQGDGLYFYVHEDGTPCPRMALELIREGLEDFEYFHLLNQRDPNNALLNSIGTVGTAEEMGTLRDNIAAEIERVTINDKAMDNWKYARFGADANNPAISGDSMVNNTAGISNLMAYALGANPYTATADVLPTGGIQRVSNVNYPKLSFTRNPSATDITYTVEGSPDLSGSNWSTISTFSNGTWSPSSNVMETSGTTTVWDTTPMNSAPRRFMRLKVIH